MAGDHKCPLCSATFTRPQHVGRHLRAHTGDRPYECKECPLRFARSDLLSRHVNKAHKPPDGNGIMKAPVKKGRRKSMPSNTIKPPPPNSRQGAANDDSGAAAKARRASFDVAPGPSNPQPPLLQAQSMYPHHPLLAGTPQPADQSWSSPNPAVGINGMMQPNFMANPNASMNGMMNNMHGNNGLMTFQPPFTAVPMRLSGSDQSTGTSPMGRNGSLGGMSGMGYDFGFKKRACDQCNHSKVRCDFAEPCLRCSQRNLRCSYNKPPKSRSIATIPSQRISLPLSATTSSMTGSLSASSASPTSHFSSPHSNPSPHTATRAPPIVSASANPQSYPSQMAYVQNTPSQWSQNFQWSANGGQMADPSYGVLQQSPQTALFSSPTQLGQYTSLPPTQTHNMASLPLPMSHRNSASSINSPQGHLVATPSLTSNSTSPPVPDEPAERRTSTVSFNGNLVDPKIQGMDINSTVMDQSYGMPNKYSPTNVNGSITQTGPMQPEFVNPFAWTTPGSATIDPRNQFRTSISSEDSFVPEYVSRPSTASTQFEHMDEVTIQALNQRRRSSGVWASAFNQMTLQDSSLQDPNLANHFAGQYSARRPTFPGMSNISEVSDTTRMPSLDNVKDLWRLFMTEPSTGAVANNNNVDIQEGNMYTPAPPPAMSRPQLGPRARSNSMPTLLSPPLVGPAFFSHLNGATPRPGLPQQSYVHPQEPADGQPEDPAALRRWKDSIQTRQKSFEFDPHVESKLKVTTPPNPSSTSPPVMAQVAPQNSMLPPRMDMLSGDHRPRAGVLQHSSALLQTLAPERTPSFGLDNPTPNRNQYFMKHPPAQSKLTSALARPGNKRLASQTLVPNDSAKKTSGEGWVEGVDNGAEMGRPIGMTGDFFTIPQSMGTGMTPTVESMAAHTAPTGYFTGQWSTPAS